MSCILASHDRYRCKMTLRNFKFSTLLKFVSVQSSKVSANEWNIFFSQKTIKPALCLFTISPTRLAPLCRAKEFRYL